MGVGVRIRRFVFPVVVFCCVGVCVIWVLSILGVVKFSVFSSVSTTWLFTLLTGLVGGLVSGFLSGFFVSRRVCRRLREDVEKIVGMRPVETVEVEPVVPGEEVEWRVFGGGKGGNVYRLVCSSCECEFEATPFKTFVSKGALIGVFECPYCGSRKNYKKLKEETKK